MAQQGSALVEPYLLVTVEEVAAIQMGDLITPFVAGAPSRISATAANRFPVPPTAGGFLEDDLIDVAADLTHDRLLPIATGNIAGALTPEGKYMEPTLGQIWPR